MSTYVVDASVAVKWFVPEVHSGPASKLLDEANELHAPDLLLPEFGNTLWKKFRREELNETEVNSVVQALSVVPLAIHPSLMLLEAAVAIALHTSRTVYDSFYLALAVLLKCPFVTADDHLLNALRGSSLSDHVRHVKEL
jgi:predicted nucleic acid-binding protein